MSDQIRRVDTSKYTRSGKVDIDGHVWTVRLPGAGKELQMSKAQRRLKFLDKKLEAGTENEADLDKYDQLEDYMMNVFNDIFIDGTEDNSEVNKWVNDTPMIIITQAFEDIKSAAAESDPTSD